MRRLITPLLFVGALALMIAGAAFTPGAVAQQNPTVTPTFAGPFNDVQAFFVACQDAAIIDLSGEVVANFDVYYQVFAGPDGTGTALTALRQASVSGTFTFSERATYNGGTLGPGSAASVNIIIARETDVTRIDDSFTVNDVQDGCRDPQFGLGTSSDLGGGTGGGGTAGEAAAPAGQTPNLGVQNIPAPGGTTLNPNLAVEPEVFIGARPSDTFRSQTPGLIFAVCNNLDLALPGRVLDSDNVTIYWAWFSRTEEAAQDHIDNVQYSVKLNQAPFPNVVRTPIELRDGNYWVFYSANVGNLRPGHYEIEYRATWTNPINNGYNDYGPGTSNPIDFGNCNFDVTFSGQSVAYNNAYPPTLGPVHNLFANE